MDTENTNAAFLESARLRFTALKKMGDFTLEQLADSDLTWRPNEESNSIAVIVQHLHGNMLSRWTNFLTEDGDKESRDRDGEFTEPERMSQAECLRLWNEGWTCLEEAVNSLTPNDVLREVTIRKKPLTVLDAIQRQLSHYAYHVGQLVHVARERLGPRWKTLSIPRGQSKQYRPSNRD
ncbi:MAG: DUF1572 family protein [Candidatus Hydrogenedentes bacterium]|nr:DUF1572 family protein [Candidatus Hydrogenedentota bacterium]